MESAAVKAVIWVGSSKKNLKAFSEVMPTKKGGVTLGIGNVFKDLGLKNPEELLAKAKLAARIVQILEERKVSQTQAGKLLGIDQGQHADSSTQTRAETASDFESRRSGASSR